jgi:FkbM family methyltransferase
VHEKGGSALSYASLRERVRRLRAYARAFGPLRGPVTLARIRGAGERLIELRLPGFGAPILVRAGTSDKATFEQVFVSREYDTSFTGLVPQVIVDGGANVGFATRFFAQRYPRARIYAIEPEESNFELLVRNTQHLDTVTAIRGALWNRSASLRIDNPGDEKWAFRVVQNQAAVGEPVDAVTVPEVMAKAGAPWIDMLKLDIEGAERELFEPGCESWLGRVNLLIIELHDRLRPGCSDSLFRAILPYHFTVKRRGEHMILVRQPFLVPTA